MSDNLIQFSPSAYQFPLLIKHMLHAPLTRVPNKEIVYRDVRHTYRTFVTESDAWPRPYRDRRQAGRRCCLMDWDSNRYHECYFGIPMMGAVLQTVNLALPPDNLIYTLNDTGASTLLVNVDFLPH